MITTVTTTTITTIVTLTTTGASLGVLATILLISLLGTKEIASTGKHPSFKTLGRYLNVSIIPLLVVFMLIVVFKVNETLA
jgi:hypothetical protein